MRTFNNFNGKAAQWEACSLLVPLSALNRVDWHRCKQAGALEQSPNMLVGSIPALTTNFNARVAQRLEHWSSYRQLLTVYVGSNPTSRFNSQPSQEV